MAHKALTELLLEGAARVAEVPREEIPDALAEVERLRASLWSRGQKRGRAPFLPP